MFHVDIDSATMRNSAYRRVLHTTPHQQTVLMSLQPGEDIPTERHATTTQTVHVVAGSGGVYDAEGTLTDVRAGSRVTVQPNTWHRVVNASNTLPLQMYIEYSRPEHAADAVHARRSDDPEISMRSRSRSPSPIADDADADDYDGYPPALVEFVAKSMDIGYDEAIVRLNSSRRRKDKDKGGRASPTIRR
jgi:mannose-6-phosphate isomerase-like protein (cupin superfamily)